MKINENAKIFQGAQVLGDVELGNNVSVWHGAIIRADMAPIKIGNNSNVQDNCVLHVSENTPIIIKNNVSIGHGAVVHGATIEDNVIVGMNATVLNNAHIGRNSIVGAGAVVSEGKEFPKNSLILGVPAKVVKELSKEQIKHIKENADSYCKLSKSYKE